jgi:hypothetical protein
MTKRRGIISYDKLTVDQKKQILRDYPDGYINHLTTIKTPNGETLDAFIWETDEVIYLVKIKLPEVKPKKIEDEDDEVFDEELDKENDLHDEDIDEAISDDIDDKEDEYDKPTEDSDEDE